MDTGQQSLEAAFAAEAADVLEIGVPFTDPMADGLTIQRSSQGALAAGVSLAWILDQIGAQTSQLKEMVDAEMGHFPKAAGGAAPQPGSALGRVLEGAQTEADRMKDEYVSTEHLLLALADLSITTGKSARPSP